MASCQVCILTLGIAGLAGCDSGDSPDPDGAGAQGISGTKFASGGAAVAGSSSGGRRSGGASNSGNPSGGSSSGGTAGALGGTGGLGGSAGVGAGGTTQGGSSASGGEPSVGGSSGGSGGSSPAGGAGGAASTGGNGGAGVGGSGANSVIKVTTLARTGPGSLEAALEKSGPRVIVFEVGGVIDLNKTRLDITQPFVRIAGQTAPSPGISLIRGGVRVLTNDVVIEHIRFRMGDAGATAGSGFEPDVTTDGPNAYNIVFNHLSVAWGVDENLSVSGPRMNGPTGTSRAVTIQNSIVAEGLDNSVHSKGGHSMGTLIHDYCTDVFVIGNLYAQNNERNPWYKGYATGAVVNNVIYNPGKWAIRLGPVDGEWTSVNITPAGPRVSIVGNYMKHGNDTPSALAMIGTNSRGSAYMEDNIAVTASGAAAAVVDPKITVLKDKPIWRDGLTPRPASAVVDWVLANAGARPKDRDSVDQRIVADFKAGTGSLIDSQDDVGGYPAVAPTQRTLAVPPSDIDARIATFTAQVE